MEVIPKKELSQHELNIIAENIETVAKAGEIFKQTRLKDKAILILLKHSTGLAERDIKLVLDAIPLLERDYLKPKSPKVTK